MTPEQHFERRNPHFRKRRYNRGARFGRMDADLADVESAIVRSREFLSPVAAS
jgi:hypothetical protein